MCWLPVNQCLPLAGDSVCARGLSPCSVVRTVATRLRMIGDQLERSWTVGGDKENAEFDRKLHFNNFVCTAIHITVLILCVRKRHL